MNEKVIKVLNEQIWYLATYSDEANCVPVGFKSVTEDGKLLVGDVMLNLTMKNVQANGKIAVSVCDLKTSEGYQIKGTAEYLSEGPIVENLQKIAAEKFHGALACKGALLITPEKVLVTTPGPDNGKAI
ncbi:MAG: pyridoxamine 5'-phosphate oxidase family protein [Lachnospiraceae bacterium]|jgi:predicted pyridoxine 5'-phosphate oxidase superfamily flavin-nucleotide-binding protein